MNFSWKTKAMNALEAIGIEAKQARLDALEEVVEELKEKVATGYFPSLSAEEASNRTKKQALDIIRTLKEKS